MPPRRKRGPVEVATAKTLKDLIEVSPVLAAMAAAALKLAQTLDGDAGMATAAVARELRATLESLAQAKGGGGDDVDNALQELSRALGGPVMPAAVGYAADVQADAGREGG